MKINDIINKKFAIAEKRILELINSGDLKKLSDILKDQIARFYEAKSLNRIETSKIIYKMSNNENEKYKDYSESVTAAYYSMYYIVHAYLADKYKTQLRENVRGVHAITHNIILYYLVKTEKLAHHLYQEYVNTFKTTAQIQKLNIEDFQKEAYKYAEVYDKSRTAREIFTYNVTQSAEEYHAKQAINTAEEFISTIRQLMLR